MGILQRFKDIMESNVNALLDKCEDPAKMVDQTLVNLRKDFAQVKKETANVIADEKAAQRRLDECNANITRYQTAAQNALKAGNEDDARELIARKQVFESDLVDLQKTYDMAHANAVKMKQLHDKLSGDIISLENRKDTIKAKVSAAKAQEHMNKVVSGSAKSEASISTFERMEAKADKMLDSAMAEAELNENADTADNLADKYTSGSSNVSVDDELASMKAKLGL